MFPGGGGGVGIQGVQHAKVFGTRPIVVDSGEQKRKLALDLGAEELLDFEKQKMLRQRSNDSLAALGLME